MGKIGWTDALTQNVLVTAMSALLLWWRRRKDPAATTPGQRLTRDGVVICTTGGCNHEAMAHDFGVGCTLCPCTRRQRSFVLPREA